METKFTLSVNHPVCIRCGRCIKACPAQLFGMEKGGEKDFVAVSRPEDCIRCGHCAAVCPVGAIQHSLFPASKVHAIDYAALPTADQMELLCRARRSNRAFNGQPVPAGLLNRILDAAHRAPTASNLQQVEFTLVSNPQVLHQISEYTIGVFAAVEKKVTHPLLKPVLKMTMPEVFKYVDKFRMMKEEFAKGNDLVLRGATAVLFIHTPEKSRFGAADANLAYQNGSLMAECLGVSQFYTGFVCTAAGQDKENKLAQMLGITGTIHAGMALGMPAFRYPNYIDREELRVKMIL